MSRFSLEAGLPRTTGLSVGSFNYVADVIPASTDLGGRSTFKSLSCWGSLLHNTSSAGSACGDVSADFAGTAHRQVVQGFRSVPVFQRTRREGRAFFELPQQLKRDFCVAVSASGEVLCSPGESLQVECCL